MTLPDKPKLSGSGELFKNPLLERLTHTHISVPLSIFSLFSTFMLCLSLSATDLAYYTIIGLFLSGIFTFTLIEYVMHRFVYHMKTSENKRLKRLQYLMHGVHHDFPKDKSRLAMPPVVSVAIAILLLFLTYSFMEECSLAFLPGFIIGYAGYLFVHYMIHAYPPPKNKFRVLWIHHSVHHYKDQGKAFGVSSPIWDYVFGTMP